MHEFVFVYDVYLYTITGKWIYRKQDTRRDLCCKEKQITEHQLNQLSHILKECDANAYMTGIYMKDGDLFERKEVKLWLNHEKNYDLKSNFMFEENTIKIDWRTISEHLKKTIIHAINQRETKFENIYLVFSHKYSNECIQKISHCMEVNKIRIKWRQGKTIYSYFKIK